MPEPLEPLILGLLEWLSARPRPYPEVMEAWRTSCPRLPVWEEANDRGLIARRRTGAVMMISLTPIGRALLDRNRHPAPTGAPVAASAAPGEP